MKQKLVKINIENKPLVGTMGFLKDKIRSCLIKYENDKRSDESIWNI